MKRAVLLAALAASMTLSGCAGLSAFAPPTAPAVVANRTVLDEQALLALELAYKAARLVVETGVDAGAIHGDTAAKIARFDDTAYKALGAARLAYAAGNAADYGTALREGRDAISAILTLSSK
jgi:hypothetical protein